MKKISKFLLMILCSFIGIISVSADTVDNLPDTITMILGSDSGQEIIELVPGVRTYKKTANVGGKTVLVYCIDPKKPAPTPGTVMNKEDPLNSYPGVEYIVRNPFKSDGYTELENYYVTQTAIWWYMDKRDQISDEVDGHLPASFKARRGNDGHVDSAYHLATLADIYVNNLNYAKPVLTLKKNVLNLNMNLILDSSTNKSYYESNSISLDLTKDKTTSSAGDSYIVSLTGAPEGTQIIDSKGNVKTEFAMDESFKVRVPSSSLNNISTDIKVTVTSYGGIYTTNFYKSTDSTYQRVVPELSRYMKDPGTSDSVTLKLTRTELSITKKDITNSEEIEGATLELYDSNNKLIDSWVSTKKPYIIKDLTPGNYYLKETIAPDGYVLNVSKVSFTLQADGKVKNVAMTNSKTVTKISKQDIATSKEIAGAHLVLKDSDNNIIDEWDSTDEAHYIYGLVAGSTYYLEETIAPDGYVLSNEVVEFKINSDGTVTEVIMHNTAEVIVPPTAASIPSYVYIVGAFMILFGLRTVFKKVKN